MNWRQLDGGIQQLELELRSKENRSALPQAWNVQTLLVALEPYFRSEDPLQNVFTGEPLREEATPGNLLFRPTARGTEVLWHDVDCVEHILATLPTRAP